MVIVTLKPRQYQPPVYIIGNQAATPNNITWRLNMRPNIWSPPTDVYETEEKLIVRMEIAGMDQADFIVKVDQNHLLVSGIRPDVSETRAYHQMEIPFGEFSAEVEISIPIAIQSVEAQYQDGFLYVFLPKAQPKQVNINE